MAARKSPCCVDRNRLLADYNHGVTKGSEAVRSLNDHAGSDRFALMMAPVDKARAEALRSKAEYASHVTEHGC
jgi:hypothetical protein